MNKKRLKGQVAIFIDAANFEISLKQCGLYADYHKLIKEIKQYGKPSVLRYYSVVFKTKGQDRFFSFIKNCGFKIVTKDAKIIKSKKGSKHKANFDVEITFDAAVRIGQFDTLILFSGDSDFVYLISQLQKREVKTIAISPAFRTAKELRSQVDKFIDLRNCEFAKKKLPFGSAHNNLSTAKRIYQKK
jgi:uncharacterized LabA/DUF88 family protein